MSLSAQEQRERPEHDQLLFVVLMFLCYLYIDIYSLEKIRGLPAIEGVKHVLVDQIQKMQPFLY